MAAEDRRRRRVALRRLAARQHGVVAMRQLVAVGYSPSTVRRMAAREGWTELGRGVWALAGVPHSWERDLQAALLACGERSVTAGLTALGLHGLARVPLRRPVDVLVPHDRTPQPSGATVRRTTTLVRSDVVTVRGLRVTTVARTFCDISASSSHPWLRDRVALAVQERRTTLDAVAQRSARLGRHRGARTLRRALVELGAHPTDSGAERRTLRWLTAEGLAPDETQFPIRCSDGVTVRADFAWVRQRVSLEYLGDRWHSLPSDLAKDAVRTNGVVTAGWLQLLLTEAQLTARDPRFLTQLRAALAGRG